MVKMWKAHFLACDEYQKTFYVFSSIIQSWKDEMDWDGLGWSITAYPESFHMLGSNWEISRSEQVLLADFIQCTMAKLKNEPKSM